MRIKQEERDLNDFFRLLGLCLFASQRIEIGFQGIIATFFPLVKDKKFKGITSKSFFEDSPSGKKLRKKTLGVLKDGIKDIDILPHDRIERYVIDRNFIIHDFLRTELSSALQTNDFDNCIEICNKFIEESDKIEKGIKGMFYVIFKALNEMDEPIENYIINNWKEFEDDLNKL